MAKVTARQFTEKLIRNAQNASQDYVSGIDRVTEAPGVKAAEKAERMLNGIMESIQSGRWQASVANVSLNDWKNAAKGKGVQRYSQGLQAAAPQIERVAQKLLEAVDRVKAQVDQMPDATLEDRINRSAFMQREMAKLKGTFKGS